MPTSDINENLLSPVSNYFRRWWGKVTYRDRYDVTRYILITTLKTATDHSDRSIDDFVDGLIQTELSRRYSNGDRR